jgi:hypothetical protein
VRAERKIVKQRERRPKKPTAPTPVPTPIAAPAPADVDRLSVEQGHHGTPAVAESEPKADLETGAGAGAGTGAGAGAGDSAVHARMEAEMRASIIYDTYTEVCEEALLVIRRWGIAYASRPDIWARITKSKDGHVTRVVKEFIEAAPIIQRARDSLAAAGAGAGVEGGKGEGGKGDKVTVVDLCSGFGFMGMFLSELLPAPRVSRVLLIDTQWSSAALRRDAEQAKAAAARTAGAGAPPGGGLGDGAGTGAGAGAGAGLGAGADAPADGKSVHISADHFTGEGSAVQGSIGSIGS